jgi:capsular polysaccharide biosynthesis protein
MPRLILRFVGECGLQITRRIGLPVPILIRLVSSLYRRSCSTDEVVFEQLAVRVLEAWLSRTAIPQEVVLPVIKHKTLTVSGWAADPDQSRRLQVKRVNVYRDSVRVRRIRVHRARHDVAAHFADQRLRRSGFTFSLESSEILQGSFSCTAVATDGSEHPIRLEQSVERRLSGTQLPFVFTPFELSDSTFGYIDDVKTNVKLLLPRTARCNRRYVRALRSIEAQRNWPVLAAAELVRNQRFLIDLLTILLKGDTEFDWRKLRAVCAVQDRNIRSQLLKNISDRSPTGQFVELSINRMERVVHSELLEESSHDVDLPPIWGTAGLRRPTRLTVPALGIYHLTQARIAHGSTVVSNGELFLYDLGCDSQYEFAAGTWDHLFTHSIAPDRAILATSSISPTHLRSAVLLTGRSANNYFHSLIEYLPRIFLVLDEPNLQMVPIVITDDWPSSVQEALEFLSRGRKVLRVSRSDNLTVDDLFIPSMHTCIFDSTRRPWIEGSRFSHDLLDRLRTSLWEWSEPLESRGDRVFILRKGGARTLENAEEIEEIAANFEFHLIAPETLTPQQQIGMFATASKIVGIGGAAMANSVFCTPGTRILAMVSEQLRDFVIHSAIARHAGANMELLLGRTTTSPTRFEYRRDFMHAPFRVSPRSFRRALELMVRS